MIFLWSDVFIFFIAFLLLFLLFFAYRSSIYKLVLQKLFYQKSALVSLLFLSIYFCFAIFDSIHFKNINLNGERVISLLDYYLNGISSAVEKTYSAPFSVYGFSKEITKDTSAEYKREYPKLLYAGKHLTSITQYRSDIQNRLCWVVLSTIITIIFIALIFFLFLRKYFIKNILFLISIVGFFAFIFFFFFFFYQKYHILGTDKAGYDVLYKSIKSIRTGILIGTLTTVIVIPTAILFGVLAGYFGGIIDDIIQYLYTTLESIPSILLIAATMLIVDTLLHDSSSIESADNRLIYLCLVLGVTSWTSLCRLTRGETLKIREMEYIQAARALGTSKFTIMVFHIVPNLINIILIVMTLHFSGAVLSEAALTYVGIGADPSIYSWGNMINQARFELARTPSIWWNLVGSFIFMIGLILPANIFADNLRDALDPKFKNKN